MRKAALSICCLSTVVLTGISATARANTVVVKRGNSLSKIAGQLVPGPVWGENGSLKKIRALNPHIQNPNFIVPGMTIDIDIDGVVNPAQATGAGPWRIPAEASDPVATEEQQVTGSAQNLSDAQKVPPFERGALLALTPSYAFSGISATDSATGRVSSVASQYNVGVRSTYFQEWSPFTRSFVGLKLGHISFDRPTDSSLRIADDKKFLSEIQIGANFNLSSRLSLATEADYKKELFARAVSTQIAKVEAVAIPSLGAKLAYDFIRLRPFSLGVSTSFTVKGPAKTDGFNVRLGAQYGSTIYLKQFVSESGSPSFQTELSYLTRMQNTSLTKQTQKDLTLEVRLFVPVGDRDKGDH